MSDLPEHVTPLDPKEQFTFSCHPGVTCFTECCRKLELALSPYDVLRLKQSLALSSQQFLDEYAIIEFLEDDLYPKVYLGMVDDGRASCPFVSQSGCQIYDDRPGACRTYPLGRGAHQSPEGAQEIFVLVHEAHCQGFEQKQSYTVQSWHTDQSLQQYNDHNDILLPIFNASSFRKGNRLSDEQAELFTLALYNIDSFKELYSELFTTPKNDLQLLNTIVGWLENRLF